ncbi:MAG TPA: sugar transferase, partial [Pyrinomonadaceae bacterium]|nr:sugar transferase [Pyrinomonadaceae bacterium]
QGSLREPEIPAGLPRFIEAAVAAVGLVLTAPIMILAAIAIALESRGPILFRQERVGLGGRNFTLYKFRTMVWKSSGPQITGSRDTRVTPFGNLLRRTKLDELPELLNVLRGDMALVGPRPEVPCYVNTDNQIWQQVLRVKPGVTHPVTVRLRNEETLIASARNDTERFYLEVLLPYKLRGYLAYQSTRTWQSDMKIIALTLLAVLYPGKVTAPNLTS